MLKRVQGWLDAIPINTPLERRQAGLFQIFLLIIIGSCLVGPPIILLTMAERSAVLLTLFTYALIATWNVGALVLLRRGHFSSAVRLALVGQILALGLAVTVLGLQKSQVVLVALSVPIALAGILLGRSGMLLAASLSSAFVVIAGLLETFAPSMMSFMSVRAVSSLSIATGFILIIAVLSLCLDRFGSSLRAALGDVMAREQELDQLRIGLEDTVAERTASLQQALQDGEQRELQLTQTLADLHASQKIVRELSAPVIPVLPGVLVAPLIGVLDSDRAAFLADNVLGIVEREHARQVIFDVTGVPIVDTQVAQVLIQTAAAVQLLGAQTLLVGIRPEVAQTIITLGLNFATIPTYSNLQEAVAAILATGAGGHLNSQLQSEIRYG